MKGGLLIKKLIFILLSVLFFTGCSFLSTEDSKLSEDKVPTLTPINPDRPLKPNEKDASSFFVEDDIVAIIESTASIQSIEALEWIDEVRVAVTCRIDTAVEYFTIYNTQDKVFEFSVYGTNFIWEDRNLRTLVYLEPLTSLDNPNTIYRIYNYQGKTLYESPDKIKDLKYISGILHFNTVNKKGKKTARSLEE